MVTSFFVKAIIVIVFMISGNYAQNDGICSMDNYNKTYVCQFNENCWSSNRNQHISCLDDKDCQIECNGRRSCAKSTITCPEYGNCHVICSESGACYSTDITWSTHSNSTGNITCNGKRACWVTTFPQPAPFEDMVLNCNHEFECTSSTIKCPEYGNCHIICSASHSCALSTIKCPKYGNCHIVCSESNACFDTDIVWSNQPVRSTLTCNATESKDQGCDSTTQPPLNYEYMFDNIYNITTSHNLGNDFKITSEFEMYFQLKMYTSTQNTPYYSILSIMDDANVEIINLFVNNKDGIIQMKVADLYFVQGAIPADNQYHSVNIAFTENNQITFKVDTLIYFNLISSDTYSLFSSLSTNNKSYSLFIGDDNNILYGEIATINLTLPLSNYFQISDDSSFPDVRCYQIVNKLPDYFELPVAAYWDSKMILFDGFYSFYPYMFDWTGTNVTTPYQFRHIDWCVGLLCNNSNSYRVVEKFEIWTQVANTLYVWSELDNGCLNELDLSTTDDMFLNWLKVDSSYQWHKEPCLCSDPMHLFLLDDNTIAIYEIDYDRWTIINHSIPRLEGANCQVYQDKMYVFGGEDSNGEYMDTIYEYHLWIPFMNSYLLNVTLSEPAKGIKSTQQNEYIYLYGGNTLSDKSLKLQIFNAMKLT
eukprot:177907_1